jgi:hypothetical protein
MLAFHDPIGSSQRVNFTQIRAPDVSVKGVAQARRYLWDISKTQPP